MSSNARAVLKSTHKKVSAFDQQIKSLESAAEQATHSADEALAELQKHGELDAEITHWRVNQVKAGKQTKVLPENLKDRVEAKRAAADELEQSQSVLEAIQQELENLRSQRKRADRDHIFAAGEVLAEIAGGLGAELKAINTRRAVIVQILSGLQRMDVFIEGQGHGRLLNLDVASESMDIPEGFRFPHYADPSEAMAARWKARLNELLADPDAAVGPPPHVTTSDYRPGAPSQFQGPGLPWTPMGQGTWAPEEQASEAEPAHCITLSCAARDATPANRQTWR
jgi:hypothetical protein